jgi:hypothetical protein
MKTLRLILAFLIIGIAISSCQKDVSFEGGNAKGSLGKTTAGDCDPIFVNGLFYKDTTMNASNFVDVQIDFTKIGIYNIKTDTVNGYSFVASGSTGTLGLNTIRLFGKGKPLAPGFNVFTVKYDGSQCSFTVQVTALTGGGTGAAVYAFGGSPGACTGAVLGGTYISGVPMAATNNVTIPITVTTAGTYNITTIANGVTFSGSGVLTTASTSIVLTATGTSAMSATPVNTNYPIASGTSNCSFDVPYAATPAGGAAVYTFGGAACTGFVLAGTYTSGTTMTAANTVMIPVTVTTAGTYNITTTANGVTFAGSGMLTLTTTSIILTATGTPAISATAVNTNYPINSGTSTCSFTVPYAATTAGGAAVFTFNCGAVSPVINGTYTVGVPMGGANSITIPITLTTPGTYNITVTAVNGVSFSGLGSLPAGATSLTLLASGTGTAAATPFTNFTVTSGASNCMFTIPFAPAAATGTLSFLSGATLKTFNANQLALNQTATAPAIGFEIIFGGDASSAASNVESLAIYINKPTAFAPGTFTVNTLPTNGIFLDVTYTDPSNTDYLISSGATTQTPGFTVVITSLSATRIIGTFSGTLKDAGGVPFVITGGIFDLPL